MTSKPFSRAQTSSDVILVSALTEAVSINRLPTPEPVVCTEDPLKFNVGNCHLKN